MKKPSKFSQIWEEIGTKNTEVTQILDEADEKNGGELTTEQAERVKSLNKEIEILENRAAETKEGDAMREQADRRRDAAKANRLDIDPDDKGDGRDRRGAGYREAQESLGRQVVNHPDMKNWRDGIQVNGRIPENTPLRSPSVPVRLITSGDTSAGGLIRPDYYGVVDAAPFRTLELLDLIAHGETSSNLVEFVRILGYTNNAAVVPEATGTGNGSGAKPESDMQLEPDSEAVKTIAHWISATTSSLADAPMIRTLIDKFLRFGLNDKLEYQIVNGSGVGNTNFLGILNTPGIQTQDWSVDMKTTIRKARTKVKVGAKTSPNGVLLNPLDWEALDLDQDEEGRYYWGGPSVLGIPRVWGVPVVEDESVAEGVGIMANFLYAILWDRMQATITMSNSHSDFFVRNMVAILAELRAAFTVLFPKAFVKMDLTAGP